MSRDALGWRCKFAVVAPSTNTIVQPDMDSLRVKGVTNHYGRIHIPNMKVGNDEEFVAMVEAIGATLYDAVDRCMTCEPDYLVMGMSALMFGRAGAIGKAHAGVVSALRSSRFCRFLGLRGSAKTLCCQADSSDLPLFSRLGQKCDSVL